MTTGQRKSLDQVEKVQQKQGEDGNVYWTYDHISQVQMAYLCSVEHASLNAFAQYAAIVDSKRRDQQP